MINAFGIAYQQAGGNLECVRDGAMTKRMSSGFAARGGVTAVLMAEAGITGCRNSFQGERGLYNLYHAGLDDSKLLGELGKRFEGINVSLKPYPCCRGNHYWIDTVLQLVREKDIRPEEIEEIIPSVHPHAFELLCSPPETKRQPRNVIDSQFSLPWTLACAVVRRKVGMTEFTDSALEDTTLQQMAQKVHATVDSSLRDTHAPGIVTIKTKARGTLSKRGGAGHEPEPQEAQPIIQGQSSLGSTQG